MCDTDGHFINWTVWVISTGLLLVKSAVFADKSCSSMFPQVSDRQIDTIVLDTVISPSK